MSAHSPIDHQTLGRVTWNEVLREWHFEAGPIGERSVLGRIVPAHTRRCLRQEELDEIAACLFWFRANEALVRRHIADWLFREWFASQLAGICSPEGFADAAIVASIFFGKDRKARICYTDGGSLRGLVAGVGCVVAADGIAKEAPALYFD
jgi:hypothetical protein